jgi:hypothetical protein
LSLVLNQDQSDFQKELSMSKKRFAKAFVIVGGLMFLLATPKPARAGSAPSEARQPLAQVSPRVQVAGDPKLNDDFAGLDLSDDQKAEIAKIHQNAEAQKTAVAKAESLTSDQKDAMILGYTRLEYGRVFKALTPIQQRVVRSRMQARHAADQAAQKNQPPTR